MTASTLVKAPVAGVQERVAFTLPGIASAAALLFFGLASLGGIALGVFSAGPAVIVVSAVVLVTVLTLARGLIMVSPGEARVLQFLGRYSGTLRQDGLSWVNPFTERTTVSTRIRNHESAVLKVNDADGNPIEIAAVVVWQVADTAKAVFDVDNFVGFVGIQTETAVRHIATSYAYDNHGETGLSLRENADEITEKLSAEISARITLAGVHVIESRITHLAYAQEIAHAMLQRQQAGAMVAARQRIVEGAVGMVELALARLAEHDVVELDEERKAAMVSNLLVVLCGDRATQPVVNAGSLYH
ncbi:MULTISPECIES: SPFH domain-containing protein [unclassified Crossiella]|uniref:SPFH domain-containing protein n=1 Tax=unclassified Crossiella TaxID=2620835 RepID=UPI0020004BB5|nr:MULTISPECIES: SPFH domain-containing protein [unclassified Crossiella]MCK2241105.1 SPFH domain-containing protein [Crossiella sp. S99.2]MCK2253751.1 SPFH domain-containing protein [Crossiella sp. S99.1]